MGDALRKGWFTASDRTRRPIEWCAPPLRKLRNFGGDPDPPMLTN
jgi:hypothetical protein